MAAKDSIHDVVKHALMKDNWIITDDPYTLEYEDATLFIDLGAERIIAAERGNEKIAVEVKSFIGPSAIHEFEQALGQYILYLNFLEEVEPDRKLYIAINDTVHENIFCRKSIQFLVRKNQIPIIVVNIQREEILLWTN